MLFEDNTRRWPAQKYISIFEARPSPAGDTRDLFRLVKQKNVHKTAFAKRECCFAQESDCAKTMTFVKCSYLLYNYHMIDEVDKLDRIIFEPEEQRKFIENVASKLNVSTPFLAGLLAINRRTLCDWKREKYHMSFIHAKTLAQKSGVQIPTSASLLKWNKRLEKIGSLGGKAMFKKYGRIGMDEDYRRVQWTKWWNEKGKYQEHKILWKSLPFRKPMKSPELAEFVGLMLGDGGITRYQLTVTLHRYDDHEYGIFVCSLIQKLFGVRPSVIISKDALANDYRVSRTEMVHFCIEHLGLVKGNKIRQKIDIPMWIKRKRNYLIPCIRGLFDTDGSVYWHQYRIRGKDYRYKKISFTSASPPLLNSVHESLRKIGVWANMRDRDIFIESRAAVKQYIELIGSHNPKHLRKMNK